MSEWLQSLTKGDKLDVLQQWRWKIASVINLEYTEDNQLSVLTIHCNGKDERIILYNIKRRKLYSHTLSRLSPLHRHTSRHHYEFNRNGQTCDIEWSYIKCSTCNRTLCSFCWQTSQCEKCMVNLEKNETFNAIKESNIIIKSQRIISLIVEYSMGHVINCSNSKYKCNNKIIIHNQFEFLSEQYFYYNIDIKCNSDNNNNDIVKIYGKYRRFSCGLCVTKRCNYLGYQCKNEDTEFNVCLNHPICSICGTRSRSKSKICKKCRIIICESCKNQRYDIVVVTDFYGAKNGTVCKNCIVLDESNNICNAILRAIKTYSFVINNYFDINIIKYISEYSMGIGVICSRLECNEEIITNNMFEYEYEIIDIGGNKISHYKPGYIESIKSSMSLVSIYGLQTRVFCGKCIKMSLMTQCKYSKCKIIDCKDICYNHVTCSECNKYESYALYSCKKCNKYCCNRDSCCYKNECKTCIIKSEYKWMNKLLSKILV